MNGSSLADLTIRWKGRTGVGLVLVLVYGLINFGAAIGVPMTLEVNAV